jgi:hypothetical protein
MFLPGNLQATTLGDVLGQLNRLGASGVLELIERSSPAAGRRHCIHLHRGLVTDVDSPTQVPRLGEVLMKQGVLSTQQHGQLVQRLAVAPGQRAGKMLLQSGMVNARQLSGALADQTRMRVDALFGLHDAAVRFHADGCAALRGRGLPASDFLHGRARARDRARSSDSHADTAQPVVGDDMRADSLAVLGLGRSATAADVRIAFRRMAAAVHPDLHPEASDSERERLQMRLAALSVAYHHLITHCQGE